MPRLFVVVTVAFPSSSGSYYLCLPFLSSNIPAVYLFLAVLLPLCLPCACPSPPSHPLYFRMPSTFGRVIPTDSSLHALPLTIPSHAFLFVDLPHYHLCPTFPFFPSFPVELDWFMPGGFPHYLCLASQLPAAYAPCNTFFLAPCSPCQFHKFYPLFPAFCWFFFPFLCMYTFSPTPCICSPCMYMNPMIPVPLGSPFACYYFVCDCFGVILQSLGSHLPFPPCFCALPSCIPGFMPLPTLLTFILCLYYLLYFIPLPLLLCYFGTVLVACLLCPLYAHPSLGFYTFSVLGVLPSPSFPHLWLLLPLPSPSLPIYWVVPFPTSYPSPTPFPCLAIPPSCYLLLQFHHNLLPGLFIGLDRHFPQHFFFTWVVPSFLLYSTCLHYLVFAYFSQQIPISSSFVLGMPPTYRFPYCQPPHTSPAFPFQFLPSTWMPYHTCSLCLLPSPLAPCAFFCPLLCPFIHTLDGATCFIPCIPLICHSYPTFPCLIYQLMDQGPSVCYFATHLPAVVWLWTTT